MRTHASPLLARATPTPPACAAYTVSRKNGQFCVRNGKLTEKSNWRVANIRALLRTIAHARTSSACSSSAQLKWLASERAGGCTFEAPYLLSHCRFDPVFTPPVISEFILTAARHLC